MYQRCWPQHLQCFTFSFTDFFHQTFQPIASRCLYKTKKVCYTADNTETEGTACFISLQLHHQPDHSIRSICDAHIRRNSRIILPLVLCGTGGIFIWRCTQVAEGTGFETREAGRPVRAFESHQRRQNPEQYFISTISAFPEAVCAMIDANAGRIL